MAFPHLSPGARLSKVRLRDEQGKEIGQVKEWMMDVNEGKVVFVLASFNSDPDKFFALPWQMLEADIEHGGYRVKAEQEKVKESPQLEANKLDSVIGDHNLLNKIYDHYQIEAYWDNSGSSSENEKQQGTENVDHSNQGGYGHS